MPAVEDKPKKKKRSHKILDPIALERKRAGDAERRQRHEAMLRARLNIITEEEQRMYDSAVSSIEASWTRFLRECKQKELIDEVAIVRRSFENALDNKNGAIDMLYDDLDEIEEQHRAVYRSHVEVVDALLELHNTHITDLGREFVADLAEMKRDFELERTRLENSNQVEMANLRLVLQNLANEAESLEKKIQDETTETFDTAAEKLETDKKHMEMDLENVREGVHTELDTRYKDFVSTAQVNIKDYKLKVKEDQEITERISSQLKRIDRLQESVSSWRTKISRSTRDWDRRNTAILAERDATLRHLKRLKDKMQTWRHGQARSLADLSKNARDSENALERLSKKAERILRLVELCKPLETEREALLLYESHMSPAQIEKEIKSRVNATEPGAPQNETEAARDCGPTTAVTADWQYLERFWIRYNKVVLDNAALAQESHYLESENQQLQTVLKQYLDDVSVNDDVMRSSNVLLQTRSVPNVVQAASTRVGSSGRAGDQHCTVIEGNKFVNETARQRVLRL